MKTMKTELWRTPNNSLENGHRVGAVTLKEGPPGSLKWAYPSSHLINRAFARNFDPIRPVPVGCGCYADTGC